MFRTTSRAAILGGFSIIALAAGQASAQDAEPLSGSVQTAAPAEGEAIVVTGSRIARRDYSATSPIVTVGETFLDTQAGGTFGIKLQQLPQVTPGGNELIGSGQPTGRATVDLRGLGANRTLVLADGRRLQPSTSALVVDLNTIPSALVDNVEVITGGASAVYGSDAVAGVVNLRLKNRFEGFEVNGQYNITDRGDGEEWTIDGLVGTNFADGRGNVTFGLGYLKRGNAYFTNRQFYRDAFALGAPPWGSDLIPTGTFIPAADNLPDQGIVDSVFGAYGYAPGSVASSGVLGFNLDGTLFSQFGGYNFRGQYDDSIILSPFNNAVVFNVGTMQVLTSPTDRINVYARGEYDITDNLTVYGQAIYTDYRSTPNYAAGMQTQGTTAVVPVDNIFIPDDLAAILASRPDPDAPFGMRRLWTATGTSITKYDNTVYQVLGGLKGKIGENWSWDVYGSYGKTRIVSGQLSGGASFSRIQTLLTSRADANGKYVSPYIPSVNGSNGLLPNPAYDLATNDGGASYIAADGSRPCPEGLDLFGDKPLSASCAAFLQIQTNSVTDLEQEVIEATLTGTAFDLPAGPLQVALGAGYRRNSYDFTPDVAGNDLVGSFGSQAVSGVTSVKEFYAEALVPVVRDLPLVQSFDLELAYRYSDYNKSGGVNTYKISGDWQVFDALRVRGGYQRAIRAPNVTELFNPQVAAAFLLGSEDPCNYDSALRTGPNGAAVRELCIGQGVPASIIDTYKSAFAGTQTIQGGNPDLSPEKADTYTLGAVIAPRFSSPMFQRLSLSVDYYNISVKDAISSLSPDIVFRRCFNQTGDNPAYSASFADCQAIERNTVTGAPDRTYAPYFNLGSLKTSGIDFQLDWGIGLDALGLSSNAGRLDLNSVLSYLIDFSVQATPGAAYTDYTDTYGYAAAGNNGAHPEWKATTSLTWSNDDASFGVRWYHIDNMVDIMGGDGLKAYDRFDLYGSLRVAEGFTLSAGINNVFDKQPLRTFGGLPGNTDSGSYDVLGRRYFINANIKF